ncbi:MAG TPA: hypothetical protein VK492_12000 [Chitinophagaceae bacterium]|nr:hypothetical protein [Chitinophagaceae bacterium]
MLKYTLLTAAITCSLFLNAQIHVRDEPRHHNVFENEFIRILDVYLAPGDSTLYHLHNTPSVFIMFTNTNVGSQLIGKQSQKGANITGEVSYDNLNTPRTHRVWNEDTSWFHVMDIELTSTKQKKNIAVLQNSALKLLFNEQQVNGYSIELKAASNMQLPPSVNGYLLISKSKSVIEFKTDDAVQDRIMKSSHYIWIEAGNNCSVKNLKSQAANFVLLQFK